MDTAREQEKPKLQEIPLNRQTARTLGNGLKQIFPDSSLLGILVNIKLLREKLSAEQDKNDLGIIELHTTKVINFIKDFCESKEVKLTGSGAVTDWDFEFSKDKVSEEKPQSGEIPPSEDLSDKLKIALNHNIGNNFMPILGYASTLTNNAFEDPDVIKRLQSITKVSKKMVNEFSSVVLTQGKIQFPTDNQVNTTIPQIPAK